MADNVNDRQKLMLSSFSEHIDIYVGRIQVPEIHRKSQIKNVGSKTQNGNEITPLIYEASHNKMKCSTDMHIFI